MRRKLRSTRWLASELLYIEAVAKKFNITVDSIIRTGARAEAVRIANEIQLADKIARDEITNGNSIEGRSDADPSAGQTRQS